jgi:hypothetical protein
MLRRPREKLACDAQIERAVASAGHKIDRDQIVPGHLAPYSRQAVIPAAAKQRFAESRNPGVQAIAPAPLGSGFGLRPPRNDKGYGNATKHDACFRAVSPRCFMAAKGLAAMSMI